MKLRWQAVGLRVDRTLAFHPGRIITDDMRFQSTTRAQRTGDTGYMLGRLLLSPLCADYHDEVKVK